MANNMINAQVHVLVGHRSLPVLAQWLPDETLRKETCGSIVWSEDVLWQFSRYFDAIAKWNALSDLVSPHDLPNLAERHVVDALSLVPYIAGRGGVLSRLLDIGSGAGFPALALKIVVPELEVVLVERRARKVAFLEGVIAGLGLEGIRVMEGEFPVVKPEGSHEWVTARAVEKPDRVLKALRGYLEVGSTFLCQFAEPERVLGDMFHVERVEDEWTRAGWRRGQLYLVRKRLG